MHRAVGCQMMGKLSFCPPLCGGAPVNLCYPDPPTLAFLEKSQGKTRVSLFAEPLLGGRFGYFLFFLPGGEERGVRGARRGWGAIFIENCRRGGAKYFFSGPKFPPSLKSLEKVRKKAPKKQGKSENEKKQGLEGQGNLR